MSSRPTIRRPRDNAIGFCCGAMREALQLHPPVIIGELHRHPLGIALYNTFDPEVEDGFRYLPMQQIRHCPWCGKIVNRALDCAEAYEDAATWWAAKARERGIEVSLPLHKCAWLRFALSKDDIFIAYGDTEGLTLPRFTIDVPGGSLTGFGIPVWRCPGCGSEITSNHPEPSALPTERSIPPSTTHPRY